MDTAKCLHSSGTLHGKRWPVRFRGHGCVAAIAEPVLPIRPSMGGPQSFEQWTGFVCWDIKSRVACATRHSSVLQLWPLQPLAKLWHPPHIILSNGRLLIIRLPVLPRRWGQHRSLQHTKSWGNLWHSCGRRARRFWLHSRLLCHIMIPTFPHICKSFFINLFFVLLWHQVCHRYSWLQSCISLCGSLSSINRKPYLFLTYHSTTTTLKYAPPPPQSSLRMGGEMMY